MTAPAVASHSYAERPSNADPASTVDVDKPSGTAEGDLLFAWHISHHSASETITHAAPSGWTQELFFERDNGGTNHLQVSLWSKPAGASEPSTYQFACSSAPDKAWSVAIQRTTHGDGTPEIDVVATGNGSGTDMICPSVNTGADDAILNRLVCRHGTGSRTAPASTTSRWDNLAAQGLNAIANCNATSTQATAGSTGTATWVSGFSREWVTATLSIVPPQVGGDTVAPDDSHHGHHSTQVTILTLEAVQPDDSWHDHHAEQAAVTQEHLVAPHDSWHAQWSDEATLIQDNAVAPDDAWHTHTSTQAGVVAGAVVSPDDSWHVQTSNQATIAQAGTVSPDDSWHAQSSTEATVLGGVAVAPDDSWHGHTSTEAGVTTVHIVAPDDSWHQQWADEVTVSQDVPEPIVVPNVAWQHWGPIVLMMDEGGSVPVIAVGTVTHYTMIMRQKTGYGTRMVQTTQAGVLMR